jgi:hypothetical protein
MSYGLEDGGLTLVNSRYLSFLHLIQTNSGAHADHSPISTAKYMELYNHFSIIPQVKIMSLCNNLNIRRILAGKPHREELQRLMHRWQDSIKTNLIETWCDFYVS